MVFKTSVSYVSYDFYPPKLRTAAHQPKGDEIGSHRLLLSIIEDHPWWSNTSIKKSKCIALPDCCA